MDYILHLQLCLAAGPISDQDLDNAGTVTSLSINTQNNVMDLLCQLTYLVMFTCIPMLFFSFLVYSLAPNANI